MHRNIADVRLRQGSVTRELKGLFPHLRQQRGGSRVQRKKHNAALSCALRLGTLVLEMERDSLVASCVPPCMPIMSISHIFNTDPK